MEKRYRKCLRIILSDIGIIPTFTRTQIYTKTNSWPFILLFQFRAGILLYGILRQQALPEYGALFRFRSVNNYVSTRDAIGCASLVLISIRVEKTRMAISWWGVKLWNGLPLCIRNANASKLFISLYYARLQQLMLSEFDLQRKFYDFIL